MANKKRSVYQEFKKFAVKGNMIDLAVGIIIGTAFTKIVNSLVSDVIMPSLGMVLGKIDFSTLQYELQEARVNEAGEVVREAVIVKYGNFIQAGFDFFLIALVIFVFIKIANSWKDKAEDPKNPAAPTPKDIELLSEIRDILKTQSNGNQTATSTNPPDSTPPAKV
ncbi:large-conductance mechanosensitive channel protein MscL [Roseivirga sp. BDSF3-8]|uniref:large-conductance mechanosensitive channel protein MscL n=1 Tax=Roseivirga sp. BDSF3-8 TaxID=3241598 RepID=UPI0035321756